MWVVLDLAGRVLTREGFSSYYMNSAVRFQSQEEATSAAKVATQSERSFIVVGY